ncbi:30S ribosomal protein S3 [Methanoculleus bourgensis]|jgi:small subunit ribosomal protein S3|uniref:Small ribosomal subunit protein uS3 n=1 Tax=Methanoculleus bourgensis TaxID=83986 RepID=A0A7K4C1M1_9EURY|nr:30S ribosomal protein S3 [Methanoculleus bourgensis]MBT0732163.1 30S ribosomal protein S3 [Methanoculleus bourgensis]MDD3373005.1 30S ribosomal protein S3 [Methanoculleus bourgensis]NMA88042.1 30S ribosomal protein S3 [Methanoculleus bourgensis]NQS78536.1 30S ribosomal protein S3 [Methanoculleus bourgensis]SAI88953.1 30S ribosomal protein S3P [Methanoculleus bourgensis]
MAIEKKFISEGVRNVRIEKFLTKELKRAGYGGMDITRTPLGTQITIFAEKPGIVIGKGGKQVRQLTQDLATHFGIESPQVEVQQVQNPNFSAQIMAERLANALERGWYFRKAGQSTIRRVMESGALGCEVIVAGKLTGARSRTQKFTEGYVKHSGEPSETIVEKGYALAVKKLGTIGVQVKIVPPGAKLPDTFEVLEPEPKKAPAPVPEPEEVGEDELEEEFEELSGEEYPEER